MSEYYSYWHIYGSGNDTANGSGGSQYYDISFDAKVAVGTVAIVSGIIIVGVVSWLVRRRQTFREKAARRYKAVRGTSGAPSLLQAPTPSTSSVNLQHEEEGVSNQAFSHHNIYQNPVRGNGHTVTNSESRATISPAGQSAVISTTSVGPLPETASPTSDYEVAPPCDNDTKYLI